MMSRARRSFVAGVGMTKFVKPLTKNWDYPDMAKESITAALADAGVDYSAVQAVAASYCYGEPTCGQRAVYEVGLTGVPVFNVNNNCSSASTAILLAKSLIQGGMDCVLAVGFEKMDRGLSERYPEKASPVSKHVDHMAKLGAEPGLCSPHLNDITSDVIKMFAYAAREYMKKYPKLTLVDLAQIALKNRIHGLNNPNASLNIPTNIEKISDEKRMLCFPITMGMSTPTADGSAAAIICSQDFVQKHRLWNKVVEILAQHMVTDLPSTFGDQFRDICGYSMAKEAATKCYEDTNLTANDIDVLEVHDCFSNNELMMYEALQLVGEGEGVDLFRNGKWEENTNGGKVYRLGGKWVVNPSGGIISKGHPIGATGLGQCAELVWQLRGKAGKRQVEKAKVGMQHNFGIGGAAVVTIYSRPTESLTQARL